MSHVLIHLGEKPHQCQVCCMKFRSKSTLSSHTVRHTGEKPYLCEICDKKFSQKSSLTKHLHLHDEEGPLSSAGHKIRAT